jgi:hypothetical protein
MSRIVSTISDICQKVAVNNSAAPPPNNSGQNAAVAIGAPVGIGGSNQPPDVIKIQDALNRIAPADGGAAPPLATDGACGPKTKNAIQQFQLKQFGWSGADGKINPGGQTITRMNEILGGNRPLDASGGYPAVDDRQADEIFRTAMTTGILRAKKWIYAARTNLDIALTYVDRPDAPGVFEVFGRKERMRLANLYFRIDDFSPAQRRLILERVRSVFATMLQVFERPGGVWGEKAFEIDSTGVVHKQSKTATAHTNGGGFFKGGKESPFQKGQRADSIFFVRENLAYFSDLDRGTKTIVHELAHFCGDHRTGWEIEDFGAYGEPEQTRVAKLSPWQRVRHADSYARFARAAGS